MKTIKIIIDDRIIPVVMCVGVMVIFNHLILNVASGVTVSDASHIMGVFGFIFGGLLVFSLDRWNEAK